MEEPLIAFRSSGDKIPSSSGSSSTPSSVSSAQAEFDRVFADPSRTRAESERAVELLRQSRGEVGRQTGTPPPPLDAAVSDPAAQAEVVPVPTEADVLSTMAGESLVEAAPVLGERLGVVLEPERVRSIVGTLQPRPDGFPMRLEDELQHHPEDVRSELEELHTIGWHAIKSTHGFPLSAAALEDRHGYKYAPKIFALCVEVGAIVRERQEAEALKLAEERPGDKRVSDPQWRSR